MSSSIVGVRAVIRWLLLPVAAIAAWYVALAVGVILHGVAEWLCPESEVVSGVCVAPWAPYAMNASVCVGAALAAALIVLSCAWVAPSHRRTAVLLAYFAGVLAAIYLGVASGAYGAMASAIGAGAIVTWQLRRGARPDAAA